MPPWPPNARIYDVTIPLGPGTPVWPGDPPVAVQGVLRTERGDPCNVSRLTCSSHAGTHVDPPWHFIDDGARLTDVPVERWLGSCRVVRIPDEVARIEPAHLAAATIPAGTERLLLRTANSRLWDGDVRTFHRDYVALSPAAAGWLVARGIRLVGIDALSIAPFADPGDATHRTLLGAGVLVIEGLDLRAVPPGEYLLLCLPLKLAGGDGAPARVLLVGA